MTAAVPRQSTMPYDTWKSSTSCRCRKQVSSEFDEYNRLSYFRSDQGKANTSPPPKKANWFKIESVELANGDSVGVVTPWSRPEQSRQDIEIAAEAMFLQLLDKLWGQDRYVNDRSGPAFAPHVFSKQPEAKKLKIGKGALADAMHRLFTSGFIRVEEYGRQSRPATRIARSSPSIVPDQDQDVAE